MSQNECDTYFGYALLMAKAEQKEEALHYLKLAKEAGTVSERRMVIFETAMNPKRYRKSVRADRLTARGFDLTSIALPVKPKRRTQKAVLLEGQRIGRIWRQRQKEMNPTKVEKYLKKLNERQAQIKKLRYVEAWWYSNRGEAMSVCRMNAKNNNGFRRLLAKAVRLWYGDNFSQWRYEIVDSIFVYRVVALDGSEWIELKGVQKCQKK